MAMLPARMRENRHGDDPVVSRSGAEMLLAACEEAIGSYRTVKQLHERFGGLSRASAVAAIRELRLALAPFATGRMDSETMDVLLGAFVGTVGMFNIEMAMKALQHVDTALADRERELSGTALAPALVRERQRLRDVLSGMLQGNCSADMTRAEMARFLARVLDAARISHDDPESHADRLIPREG